MTVPSHTNSEVAHDATSDRDDTLTLHGRVSSGVGRGREFVKMDGYAKQFEQKLGYTPYPGTLNVVLDPESVTRRTRLDSIESIRIEGWSDGNRHYGGASCYPIRLSLERRDDAAHLAIPDRTDHDESKLELLAPNRLRDAGLNDGDRIVVTLMPPTATTTSGGGSNTEY